MNDIAQFLIHYGLPFLFMVVFVEQLGFPIPALPWLLINNTRSQAKSKPDQRLGITNNLRQHASQLALFHPGSVGVSDSPRGARLELKPL
jgi:hypothetical protein